LYRGVQHSSSHGEPLADAYPGLPPSHDSLRRTLPTSALALQEGIVQGSLFVKGDGDPGLILEEVWLMARRGVAAWQAMRL